MLLRIHLRALNIVVEFLFLVRFQGYSQGMNPEGGGAIRGGYMDRGMGYHGHRPYGRPYQPRYVYIKTARSSHYKYYLYINLCHQLYDPPVYL